MSDKKNKFPTQPSLVGKTVYLRPSTAEDTANAQMWKIQSEPQSICTHPLPFTTAADAAEAHKKAEKSPDQQWFSIIRQKDKMLVGQISFFGYNALNRSAELGLIIDPDEQKKHYGTEALELLIAYLFKYRDLNKVYAHTAEYNKGAVKLLDKLGFQRDGVLRDHQFYQGEFHNSLVYSLLRFEMDW
jgi:RimJ/RimL family protein N-acetyltransferase